MKKNTKIVYKGFLTIKKLFINNNNYDILIQKNAVAALILDKKNKYLLVEQFRPALMKNTLEIPAGIMDKKNLSPIQTMLQELKEEAKINLSEKKLKILIKYHPQIGISKTTVTIFFCKINIIGKNTNIKNDDVKKTKWISEKKLLNKIKNKKITDSKTLMAYFYYKKNNTL